jgi:hypothetical protein
MDALPSTHPAPQALAKISTEFHQSAWRCPANAGLPWLRAPQHAALFAARLSGVAVRSRKRAHLKYEITVLFVPSCLRPLGEAWVVSFCKMFRRSGAAVGAFRHTVLPKSEILYLSWCLCALVVSNPRALHAPENACFQYLTQARETLLFVRLCLP